MYRVVLAVDRSRQRALLRLGLEVSGRFDVVGVVVDEADVDYIVGPLRPDAVLVDFDRLADHGRRVLPAIRAAYPATHAVLMHDLVRDDSGARPAEVADRLAAWLDQEAESEVRVLIVDDDPHVREMFEILLSFDERFRVVGHASDGVEALEKAQACDPDAIVLDLMMPNMDGFEALPLLRALCPTAKVVVVSAKPARDQALDAGAAAFLLKTQAATELPEVLAGAR